MVSTSSVTDGSTSTDAILVLEDGRVFHGESYGAPGETFSVPGLNGDQPYTIGDKSVVILGPPFEFNAENIDQFNF